MKFKLLIGLLLAISSSTKAQFLTGNFGSRIDFSVGASPQGLASADINNDGRNDIVCANNNSAFISLLINSGSTTGLNSGSFNSPINLTTFNANPTTVSIADINGDNKNDIVVGYSSSIFSSISIFFNYYTTGTISSSNFTRFDVLVGVTPAGLTTGDIDGDGKPDIICSNFNSGTFTVLRNLSSGTNPVFFNNTFNTASGPNSTAVGDLDKDGKLDIALTNWNSNAITVYKNNSTPGNISLSLVGSVNALPTQTNPYWVSIVDFDRDSINDILFSNYNSHSFSIYRGTQINSIAFQTRIDFPQSPNQFTQAAFGTDLNYDGKPDIGVVNASNGSFSLYKNNYVSGAFSSSFISSQFNLLAGSSPVYSMAKDLDGDIRPDLIVGNFGSNNISIYRNLIVSPQPNINASNLSYVKSSGLVRINFTKGNGQRRLVILRENLAVNASPTDESWYTPNDTFGLGTQIGSGNYIVYADTGNYVDVKGLNPLSTYFVSVFEYNGEYGFSNYLISNPLVGNFNSSVVYYNKANGPLDSLGTWGVNRDGSGLSPQNFNQDYVTYFVLNNSNPQIQNNWLVAGNYTSVVFGNDTVNYNLTIPSNLIFAVDSFAVKSNITLIVIGNIYSNKAHFKDNSTIQFISNQIQSIPGYDYFNLVSAFSNKQLSGNVRVRGTLSLISNINTNSFILSLGSSANQTGNLVRTSGYVIGSFSRWFNTSTTIGNSGLFPIGNVAYYRPIQIDFTNAPSSAGQITAQFIDGNPGNLGLPFFDFSNVPIININKASSNGVWRFSNLGINGGSFTISCTGNGFDGINNLNEIRLIRRSIGGSWTSNGTAGINTGSNSNPTVIRTGMNQYGEVTFGADIGTNPLPAELINFSGEFLNGINLIKWSTASEYNNKEFKLYRKTDASEKWELIYRIDGKMSSHFILNYKFEDSNIGDNTTYYYQLVQQDNDGKENKSNIISVTKSSNNNSPIKIFPNPAKDYINIISQEDQKIQIYDHFGLIEEFNIKANITNILNLENYKSGLYILKTCNSVGCRAQSIIIQH
ncbi:MAG: FG-GAP-like repeat-containing protein [Bacteroidia bacterium]